MATEFLVYGLVALAIPFMFVFYQRYLKKRRVKSLDLEVMYDDKYKSERWKLHLLGLGYIVFTLVLALVLTLAAKELRLILLPANVVFTYVDVVIGVGAPFIILSLVVMALPLEMLMFKLFPRAIPERDKRIHLHDTLLVAAAALCLLVPLAFIPFDTYMYVTPSEIVKNSLLSFEEQHYSVSDVASLELNGTKYSKTISFRVFAVLRNGERVELWTEGSSHDPYLSQSEIGVVRFFRQRGAEISVNEPTEAQYVQLYDVEKSNKEKPGWQVVADVKAVFAQLKTIATS